MTWAKVDDHANEHRKQVAAGAEACWLWTCGLMYANRQPARDGFVPAGVIGMLYPLKNPTKLAAKLVEVGLWTEVPGGYRIHQFTEWNQTKEQRDAELAAGRARAAKSYASRQAKNEKSSGEEPPQSSPEEGHRSSGEEKKVFARSSGSTPTPTPIPLQKEIPAIVEQEPDVSDSDLAAFSPEPAKVRREPPMQAEAVRVFEAWRQSTGHVGAVMDPKRLNRLKQRLREGHSVETLLAVLRNWRNDPWLAGSSGKVYDGIEQLFRDSAQVERLAALNAPIRAPQPAPIRNGRPVEVNPNLDYDARQRLASADRVTQFLAGAK